MINDFIDACIQDKYYYKIVALLEKGGNTNEEKDKLHEALNYVLNSVLNPAKNNSHIKVLLHQLFLIYKQDPLSVSDDQYFRIICGIRKLDEVPYKIFFAGPTYKDTICLDIIKEYKNEWGNYINDSEDEKIRVQKMQVSNLESRKCIFESNQEYSFFLALKNCFPNNFVYPNMALNTIIKLEEIEDEISDKERDYFCKSRVDFVIIDNYKGYMPMLAFELDSHYHEKPENKIKDKMKNNIFEKSGIQLYRIENLANHKRKIEEFEKIIFDIIEKEPNLFNENQLDI